MSTTFTPPANATEVAGTTPGTHPQIKRLMRHQSGNPRGRNVFCYSDGSVSEIEPDSINTFWSADSTGRTTQPYLVAAWWGSTEAPYEVTAAQAAALTLAGFTVDA